jgi:hypothetical protein
MLKMKTQTVVLGVGLLVVGVVVAVIFGATTLTGRTHAIIPTGGIVLAILGGVLTILGATSKVSAPAGQFKCPTCGAIFGSETALKSHSKDKHGA